MKLKPMADNVLLKQHEAQETSIGGIILAAVFIAASALLIVAIWWTHKY